MTGSVILGDGRAPPPLLVGRLVVKVLQVGLDLLHVLVGVGGVHPLKSLPRLAGLAVPVLQPWDDFAIDDVVVREHLASGLGGLAIGFERSL